MNNIAYDFENNILKVGDKINVYSLMGCKDLKGPGIITHVSRMHGKGDMMVWVDKFRGAWHPNAVLKITQPHCCDQAQRTET